MSKGLVLISGVNGYIAAQTAKYFLDKGYSVRGTVRKVASAKALLEVGLKEYADSGKFTVVEVPDITVDGAFDEAVKDVTAIAHMASPVSFFFTDPVPIIHSAKTGTITLLNSALKAGPQLRTVVMTSSVASVTNNQSPPYTLTESDWNLYALPETDRLGKETPGPIIYTASKVAAERAFWAWRDEHKPPFTMTAINPVFVIGPPLIAPKTEKEVGETYHLIYDVFAGRPLPEAMPGATVDVRDVAALHEYPVSHPEETDGERYLASSAVGHPQAVADILRKAFPEAKERIVEGKPGDGYTSEFKADGEKVVLIDSGKAEKLLGGWIGFQDSVVETAKMLKGLL